jgi:hypothetical protein
MNRISSRVKDDPELTSLWEEGLGFNERERILDALDRIAVTPQPRQKQRQSDSYLYTVAIPALTLTTVVAFFCLLYVPPLHDDNHLQPSIVLDEESDIQAIVEDLSLDYLNNLAQDFI